MRLFQPTLMPRRAASGAGCLGILFLLAVAGTPPALAQPPAHRLSMRERDVLDRVLALTVDPRGCTRIRFAAQARDAFAQTTDVTAEVWLRPAAAGRPAALLDIDGEDPRVPERYETVDFVARSRQLFTDSETGEEAAVPQIPRLVRAAWLHRLGEDALASQWLATRRQLDRNTIRDLRDWLAWHDYSKGVNAYIARDDAEAALRFDRFAQRYADLDAAYGTAAHEVAAELRRREERRDRPAASAPPADFAAWAAGRRVAWLIDQLDEVDARQDGEPGGVSFDGDWRVTGLIAEGEPAVGALIDCIERDRRLTRSMHFWREIAESRTVLAVREPALVAVSSILRVSVFTVASTSDNFTREGTAAAAAAAARLRAYWQQFGGLAFDERLMKVLASPASTGQAAREAASNLVTLGAREVRGTTVWAGHAGAADEEAKRRAIAKYSTPTIAEAMLAAMDREVAAIAASHATGELRIYGRRQALSAWMALIAWLGDVRIAPAVVERFGREQDADAKLAIVTAAVKLGDAAPLDAWAKAVAAGEVPVPALSSWSGSPMSPALRLLHDNPTAATRAARRAIATPSHPWHRRLRDELLKPFDRLSGIYEDDWLMMKVLRPLLDDVRPAGVTYQLEGRRLTVRGEQWSWSGAVPSLLDESPGRRDRVEARVCDQAAALLTEAIHEMPVYHPLLADAGARLDDIRREVDSRLDAAKAEMGSQ